MESETIGEIDFVGALSAINDYHKDRKQKNYGLFVRHFDYATGRIRAEMFINLLDRYKENTQAKHIILCALLKSKKGSELKKAVAKTLFSDENEKNVVKNALEHCNLQLCISVPGSTTSDSDVFKSVNEIIASIVLASNSIKKINFNTAVEKLENFVNANNSSVTESKPVM